MAKVILKKTETVSVVKISGTNVSETVTLNADLLTNTEVIQGTPTCNITFAQWNVSSGAGDTITVTRGGVPVLNFFQNSGEIDMGGNGGYSDSTNNTSDLVIAITGTGNLYLTLRKAAGYASKIETAQFG
jgi:hypothetical protein